MSWLYSQFYIDFKNKNSIIHTCLNNVQNAKRQKKIHFFTNEVDQNRYTQLVETVKRKWQKIGIKETQTTLKKKPRRGERIIPKRLLVTVKKTGLNHTWVKLKENTESARMCLMQCCNLKAENALFATLISYGAKEATLHTLTIATYLAKSEDFCVAGVIQALDTLTTTQLFLRAQPTI
jgi:hypothetical protein